jgi:hypothetical protein
VTGVNRDHEQSRLTTPARIIRLRSHWKIGSDSDYMVLPDENDLVHEDFFGVRAVVAPITLKVPPYFRRRSVRGRFAVYEVSTEGYFGPVDIAATYDGPPATWF